MEGGLTETGSFRKIKYQVYMLYAVLVGNSQLSKKNLQAPISKLGGSKRKGGKGRKG